MQDTHESTEVTYRITTTKGEEIDITREMLEELQLAHEEGCWMCLARDVNYTLHQVDVTQIAI
jgi:hypothetical protein